MEPLSIATLLLYPLVLRCRRLILSRKRECNPSLRFTAPPLPIPWRSVGSQRYTWQASLRYS